MAFAKQRNVMATHFSAAIPAGLLASILLCEAALAHGGQYRGPGNVVPPTTSTGTGSSGSGSSPNGNNSGSGTGATTGASPGTPSGPASAGTANAIGSRGANRGRGAPLDDDLGRWEFWWEFGKDPWLRLRDAIQESRIGNADDQLLARGPLAARMPVQRPTEADLAAASEALAAALQSAHDRDTISSCLVALAKIGRDTKNASLHALFLPCLQSGDQELRETAAVAFGICGQPTPDHLSVMSALVADNAEGRKLSGGSAVNERTRAFAAFGQGLVLARNANPALTMSAVTQLSGILAHPESHGRDLKVAVIEALAQLPPDDASAATKVLRTSILDRLHAYYVRDLGPGERILQAHVPTAIARLLPATAADARTQWRDLLLADLRSGIDTTGARSGDGRGGNLYVAQSCALALGGLAAPWHDNTDADAIVGQTLLDAYRSHRDQQTRAFALLGLARQGGDEAKKQLLRALDEGNRAFEQPWTAMALGVLHARSVQQGEKDGTRVEPDPALNAALQRSFAAARNPSSLGAFAIAMGLSGDDTAADSLRRTLADNRQRDDIAGYVALGLGLLRDRLAVGEVRALLEDAQRRPFLMLQCVRTLGLLGDQSVADTLCLELENPDPSLVRLSAVAAALGQIGDRRSLAPLQRMLANPNLTPLTRAFAAVALGRICDKDPLPWNSIYASNTNYRASTETLTNGSSGILDIL